MGNAKTTSSIGIFYLFLRLHALINLAYAQSNVSCINKNNEVQDCGEPWGPEWKIFCGKAWEIYGFVTVYGCMNLEEIAKDFGYKPDPDKKEDYHCSEPINKDLGEFSCLCPAYPSSQSQCNQGNFGQEDYENWNVRPEPSTAQSSDATTTATGSPNPNSST